ncbi:DUF368 domain-containing protein [Candidatus Peregrinibacteria bacterium]|nr:DUF368 domain-containing protein [Candidatus Peregrinibacteria bacterium]MBT5468598.1 DUF368 domain-containing protein [Candidatus Peregrinibacteria bacterium]MBT7337153.1 DUF368 domain-containing protein [Candidatus Peregrinibacteria bacterium]
MGAADIVPGVSGGTMAFILGIYEELIDAIRIFGRREFWSEIFKGKIHRAIALPRWGFLISVGGGILFAAAVLAGPLEHALETSPQMVWSFFFGLVAASVILVGKRIQKWTVPKMITLLIGVGVAYAIVGLVPVATPNEPWFLVLCGAIAICAMILPGISGAFLLVILGKYEFILSAVNNRDIVSIAYIGIGAVVGLILFSQVLGWLFAKYHDRTIALLTGLMIGSLRKIWPWKEGDINTIPTLDSAAWEFIGFMLVGCVLVVAIEMIATRKR